LFQVSVRRKDNDEAPRDDLHRRQQCLTLYPLQVFDDIEAHDGVERAWSEATVKLSDVKSLIPSVYSGRFRWKVDVHTNRVGNPPNQTQEAAISAASNIKDTLTARQYGVSESVPFVVSAREHASIDSFRKLPNARYAPRHPRYHLSDPVFAWIFGFMPFRPRRKSIAPSATQRHDGSRRRASPRVSRAARMPAATRSLRLP
jgi:hypothetical protein